jgi:hypothetical protein
VNASIFSLAVITFDDPQNGHAVGVGASARPSSAAIDLITFGV